MLEAHVYRRRLGRAVPGKGYRFDAGATLAGRQLLRRPHAPVWPTFAGSAGRCETSRPGLGGSILPDGRTVTQWVTRPGGLEERHNISTRQARLARQAGALAGAAAARYLGRPSPGRQNQAHDCDGAGAPAKGPCTYPISPHHRRPGPGRPPSNLSGCPAAHCRPNHRRPPAPGAAGAAIDLPRRGVQPRPRRHRTVPKRW